MDKNKQTVQDALRLGLCNIVYTKINGETRTASGTLDPHLIPGEFQPKQKTRDMLGVVCEYCGQREYILRDDILTEIVVCPACNSWMDRWRTTEQRQSDPNLVHYFDVGSNGWRCFLLENLKSLSLCV